eukprot:GHVT01068147.1.p1 GENE.GHVT01068147.1~~GHVT01068147.1.p1  ORF type:complete len:140 (+),score=43.32 GHVT01068147.1:1290-1709(+)
MSFFCFQKFIGSSSSHSSSSSASSSCLTTRGEFCNSLLAGSVNEVDVAAAISAGTVAAVGDDGLPFVWNNKQPAFGGIGSGGEGKKGEAGTHEEEGGTLCLWGSGQFSLMFPPQTLQVVAKRTRKEIAGSSYFEIEVAN